MRRDLIASPGNTLVKRLRALKQRGVDGSLCLVEGPKLVEEALAAGVRLELAAAAPRLLRSPRGRELTGRLEASGVPVRWLEDRLLASLSEVEKSQGVLALGYRPRFAEEQLYRDTPLVLATGAVQEPGNVGALIRTAEAAGASGAYLSAGTPDPLSWKALRGSMGSAFRLPHVRGLSLADILARIEGHGLLTVALDSRGETTFDKVDLRPPLALFVGAEAQGLPPEVSGRAKHRVRIPMAGGIDSLNVAVATGVVMFEAARQRGFGGREPR